MRLLRSDSRKIGSLQSSWKLWTPTHCAGVIPSQRVKAWYRMLAKGYATNAVTRTTAGAA
jgi:hypothetical protein